MKAFLWLMLTTLLPGASWAELREYLVAGDSMSPTIRSGDRVVIDTDAKMPLQNGDLVVVTISDLTGPMVKRVAAIPGNSVEFREGAIWVNGQRTREIDLKRWESTIRQMDRFAGRVPEWHCLIIGDNPLNSRDSGRLGLISLHRLKGRVVKVMKAGDLRKKIGSP